LPIPLKLRPVGATVFPVEVTIDNPSKFRIGLNGDVTIKYKESPDALYVPLDSIKEDNEIPYVFIKTGNKFIKQTVKTGIQNNDEIEILEGVSEDMSVVSEGFEFIPKGVQ